MQLNELKVGDICLFSALDDKLSQMIAHLTNSDISHAALCYDNENIMEEVETGVQKNPFKERFKGRTVYIQRLNTDQDLDFQPVLQRANYFLEQNEPYNFADLYLAGILLLAKNTFSNVIDNPHTLAILKHLTVFLIREYNYVKNPDKIPMVCSQFVVACYNAGGQDYQLDFENTCLGISIDPQDNSQQNSGLQNNQSSDNPSLSLIDKVLADLEKNTSNQVLRNEHQPTSDIKTAPEIAHHVDGLYALLTNTTDKTDTPQLNATNTPNTLSHELTTAIVDFAKAHHQAHHPSTEDAVNALQSLKKYYAGFITPFDLYENTTNLRHVGIMQLAK